MYLRTKKVKEWKQINFRNIDTMLSVEFIYDLYDQYASKINWFRFKNISLYYQDDKLWSYTPEDEWEKALDNIAMQFQNPTKNSNPDIINNCYWYYHRKEILLEKFLEEKSEIDLSELSSKELYYLLFNWYQITLNQIYFINLAPVELGLQRAISELGVNEILTPEEISILYSLDENTAVIKEELAFLKTMLNINEKNREELFSKHLIDYAHVTIGYGSKPIDKSMLLSRYKKYEKVDKNIIKARILEIESYSKEIKAKKEIVNKKLDNNQLTELFDLSAKLGYMRDRKKAYLGKSVFFRNRIIDEINKLTLVKNEELKFYLMDDFYRLLIKNDKLELKEIERRKQGIYISSVSMLDSGVEAREEYYSSIKTETDDVSVLKTRRGICASPGKIKGKARICLTFEESNELEQDEILITYGTDFDFMNAIVKSKAIVTEEGGILSHASVISRELKKPCIIAFKGITKIIKNGDFIELDAGNGIIKLLNNDNNNDKEKPTTKFKGLHHISEYHNADKIGNKAFNLSELHKLKYNIPDAYFLSVDFFEYLLKNQNKFDEYMKFSKNLNRYKNDLYDLIDAVAFPKKELKQLLNFDKNTYAVRSSSLNEDGVAKSYAGQYTTELFCNTIELIIESIKISWKSLLGVGLEDYHSDDSYNYFGGVIIQKMINAEISGVLFTKNPVSNNRDCMVIESCKGVASKLVDNKVIPDRFFIDQNELKIIDEINKNNVPQNLILQLAKIGKELEDYYGCDVDIEWAYEDDILYLIQCRPITT